MINIDEKKVCSILDKIIAHELAGVNRYTHYGVMVSGLARFSLVNFFKGQASESLDHAFMAGEIMTGLNGHPSVAVGEIKESNKHDLASILSESIEHETSAAKMYHELLKEVEGKSVYLEEYARNMIGSEEKHALEMRKIARNL